jgi:hypothetical protein
MQIWPTVIPSMRRASTEWLGQWRATASSPEGGGSGIPKASFEHGEGNSGVITQDSTKDEDGW